MSGVMSVIFALVWNDISIEIKGAWHFEHKRMIVTGSDKPRWIYIRMSNQVPKPQNNHDIWVWVGSEFSWFMFFIIYT